MSSNPPHYSAIDDRSGEVNQYRKIVNDIDVGLGKLSREFNGVDLSNVDSDTADAVKKEQGAVEAAKDKFNGYIFTGIKENAVKMEALLSRFLNTCKALESPDYTLEQKKKALNALINKAALPEGISDPKAIESTQEMVKAFKKLPQDIPTLIKGVNDHTEKDIESLKAEAAAKQKQVDELLVELKKLEEEQAENKGGILRSVLGQKDKEKEAKIQELKAKIHTLQVEIKSISDRIPQLGQNRDTLVASLNKISEPATHLAQEFEGLMVHLTETFKKVFDTYVSDLHALSAAMDAGTDWKESAKKAEQHYKDLINALNALGGGQPSS